MHVLKVISSFSDDAPVTAFHYQHFHGYCERNGEPPPFCEWYSLKDEPEHPLSLWKNLYNLSSVFSPGRNLIMKSGLVEKLASQAVVSALPVRFVGVCFKPYQKGDKSKAIVSRDLGGWSRAHMRSPDAELSLSFSEVVSTDIEELSEVVLREVQVIDREDSECFDAISVPVHESAVNQYGVLRGRGYWILSTAVADFMSTIIDDAFFELAEIGDSTVETHNPANRKEGRSQGSTDD